MKAVGQRKNRTELTHAIRRIAQLIIVIFLYSSTSWRLKTQHLTAYIYFERTVGFTGMSFEPSIYELFYAQFYVLLSKCAQNGLAFSTVADL